MGKFEASPSADAPAEAEPKNPAEATRPVKKRASHRSRIKGLDQVPVETTEVIPDMVAADPEAFERIGEEISEQLDFIPSRVVRLITIRPKFRRKERRDLPPIVAPAPVTPLLGGLPSAALLAFLLVGKYIDHLPLYRLEQILLRAGVSIPRDLIIHWIHKAISLLDPVAQAIRRETLASDYIQVDETTVRYLSPGAGKAPIGYLWLVNVPGGSLFYHWGVGRGTDQLIETIGETYAGILQCDAHTAYPCYQKQQPADTLALMACLSHIRRKFHDVLEAGPNAHAALVILLVRNLYAIEDRMRKMRAGPALRQAIRASESAMI